MEMSQLRNWSTLGYLLVVCIGRHAFALTGLCQTEIGRATCFSCSDISYPISELANAPRDCCGDPYVYSMCERCLFDPDSCADTGGKDLKSAASQIERTDADASRSTEDLLQVIHDAPEIRSRYFLGKRGNTRAFLGKRGNTRAFLGKRGNTRAFLGKRANNRAFLGKRPYSGNDMETALMEEQEKINQLLGKRPNPFLGKRVGDMMNGADEDDMGFFSNDMDEEESPGPSNDVSGGEKRANPFLGKRDDAIKRSNPFLGKRDFMEASSVADNVYKPSEPFLNKRGSQYFLGKRVPPSQPTMEELKNLYMRPLARRAKYFLGKRSEGENSLLSKRQKYFLGKKNVLESSLFHAEDFVNNANDIPLSQQPNTDKRQKYFLGKRSVDDLPEKMTSSEVTK